MKQILKLEKKGDFGLNCFDTMGKHIVFSDCQDTQIFTFDPSDLSIVKLTKKVCFENSIKRLPACQWMKLYQSENRDELHLIMVTFDLEVIDINLETLKLSTRGNLKSVIEQQTQKKMRKYDHIVNWAHFNSQSQLITLSFIGTGLQMFNLNKNGELFWHLPQS